MSERSPVEELRARRWIAKFAPAPYRCGYIIGTGTRERKAQRVIAELLERSRR